MLSTDYYYSNIDQIIQSILYVNMQLDQLANLDLTDDISQDMEY